MDRYIELVYNSVKARPGEIVSVKDYKPVKTDKEVYTTMFNFSDYIVNYWKISKEKFGYSTVKEYDGEAFISYLWIDIDDTKDLGNSLNRCRTTIESISLKYDIPYESIVIYFSGGKGFHIGLHSSLFGATDFSHKNISKIAKYMVAEILDIKLTGEKNEIANIREARNIDFSIYDLTRVFRAPKSKHKSGNYKIDIDYNLVIENNLAEILRLSSLCERKFGYNYVFKESELLAQLFKQCVDKVENEKEDVKVSLDKESLKENESIFKIPTQGNRNFDLFRMAYRLFSATNLKNSEITDIMKFIYHQTNEIAIKESQEQVSLSEFRISMQSAFDRTRSMKKSSISSVKVSALALEVYKAIANAKYVDVIIDEFNADMRGGIVVGNSYSFIGRQGTLKSIMLQEICVVNALKSIDCLYLNAEMSNVALFDRIYLRMFEKSFITLIQEGKMNESDIVEVEYRIYDCFKDSFQIVSEVDLEAKNVLDIVKRKEDETKRKINLVGIDSMNSMKMHGGSEAITAFQNTKYLKEVSKTGNFATIILNHVTQGCPYTLRDCSPYVRGGAKVLDNCDAYFSFSKIIDKTRSDFRSTPQDIIYQPGIAYIRFINKRDTGNTIDKVVQVNNTLKLEPLDVNPVKVEYYE